MNRIRLLWLAAVVTLTPLTAPAQTSFIDTPQYTGIGLEVLRTPYGRYSYSEDSFSLVGFLNAQIALGKQADVLVLELPISYDRERASYSDDEGMTFTSGNPFIGIRRQDAEGQRYGEVGIRLPLASSENRYSYNQRVDVHRWEAFAPSVLAMMGLVGRQWTVDRLQVLIQGGPAVGASIKYDGPPYLHLLTGIQVRYEGERIAIANALSGRTALFRINQDFPRRLLRDLMQQVEVAASFKFGHIRPGVQAFLPLHGEAFIWSTWGLNLRVAL